MPGDVLKPLLHILSYLPASSAFLAALEAFRMHRRGWTSAGYVRRVWPGYGRMVGSISEWGPVRPGDEDRAHPGPVGWGFSSQGETWPEKFPTPVEVADDPRVVAVVEKRLADVRASEGRR